MPANIELNKRVQHMPTMDDSEERRGNFVAELLQLKRAEQWDDDDGELVADELVAGFEASADEAAAAVDRILSSATFQQKGRFDAEFYGAVTRSGGGSGDTLRRIPSAVRTTRVPL